MVSTTLRLPGLDTSLLKTEINSTEDLTKTLRSTALPLEKRLSLAWAIFDVSEVDGASASIKKLCSMLVRKDDLLAEWLFSTILRELKTKKPNEYMLSKDPWAIELLACVLDSMQMARGSNVSLDIRTVFQGPVMPLFVNAFADEALAGSAEYVKAIARIWRFVVESTSDGLEVVLARPDMLAQLVSTTATFYLKSIGDGAPALQESLLEMVALTSHAMCVACESSLNPRKMFLLFDSKVLLPVFQLIPIIQTHGAVQRKVLDMLHTGLFHAECMARLTSTLMNQLPDTAEGDQNYVQQLFDLITKAIDPISGGSPTEYAAALPELFSRYLQASALICSETRSMATNTLGLSAIVATPRTVSKAESSNSCFAMFSYLYKLLMLHCKSESVLVSLGQLVDIYFRDPCFGTTGNTGFVNSDVYKSQIALLDSWLTEVIEPVLSALDASNASNKAALASIDLILDAGPEIAQAHGDTLLGAFLHVPSDTSDQATKVLEHWISTLAKARQLDTLIDRISRLHMDIPVSSHGKCNILLNVSFLHALNLAVSQLMPFVQVSECLSTLVDSAIASIPQNDGGSKKRRRTMDGVKRVDGSGNAYRVGVLATIIANFVLASVSTVSTEQQRSSFGKLLVSKYDDLKAPLASDDFAWERLLLHYVFAEAGSRIDGMERWLESYLYPEHVLKRVLPRCVRKKQKAPKDPRVAAIAMLVVFQTATHWSVFVSSANAGIIPDSVMQSVDMENMNLTMSQMVSTFVSLDSLGALTVGTPEKENNISGVSGSKDGWGSWDGQAHTIDGTNCKGAQWRLILDWIELICEYTDDTSIHSIALRLVDGFVRARVDDPDIKTRMLLRSASFFEVGKIRDVFALALIEYAAALWKEQASGLDDISDSASGLLFVSDAMSSISGTFPSKGIAKKPAAQDPIAMVAARLPEENQAQLHVLTSDQVRVWTRLMRAVVQFPVAYWTSEHTRVIFALALAADIGITRLCVGDNDAKELQTVCRKIMEHLLEHTPSLSLLLAEHVSSVVDTLMASVHLSDQILASSRKILCSAVGALTQASFMQSSDRANAACRGLCTYLFDRLGQTGTVDMIASELLIVDAFNAVAVVTRKCTRKISSDTCKEWTLLVGPWIAKLEGILQKSLENIGSIRDTDDIHATSCLGVLVSLQSIASSIDKTDNVQADGAKLTARTLNSLGEITQHPNVLRLGLVINAIHSPIKVESKVPDILAFLIRHLSPRGKKTSSFQSPPHALQSLVAAITGIDVTLASCSSMCSFIASYAVEPLLRSLDAASFEATLVTTIRLAQKFGQSTATVASTMFTAYMHAGYRQAGGDSDPAEKRKAVQKRLGSALTALHAALHAHPSVESALHVLGAIDELLLEPTMRFTTYDISEVLGTVFSVTTLPFGCNMSVATQMQSQVSLSDLFCLVCKVLSNLVRYHTSRVLDVISLLVKVLRSLMHAFVLPAIPRRLTAVERLGIDAGSTPWIVAYAPFNARCAESYARVLDDLVRSRRSTAGFTSSRKEMSSNSGSTRLKADISGFVKLTRGTNAASTAYVVGLFAPYILAEYCIIQGGGAQSAISLRALGRGGADNASGGNSFYGFGWRPTPVLAGMQDRSNVLPCDTLETNVSANSSGRRGVISSMAVREALLPGLHALLDVMGDDNRNTLLAQLAGPSNDTRQGLATNWSSLFGPDRYGGASEILKSLYKSYLDFYKYSGQV